MHDDYIIHYGIKGMRWGVRKDNYNTKKGPALTTGSKGYAGNIVTDSINKFIAGGHPEAARKNSGAPKTEEEKKAAAEKRKETDEKLDKAIKGLNATGKVAQRGSSAAKKIGNATRQPREKQDLSQLSDAELQKRVNRINLERQYNSLTQPEVKSGWDKASEILDVTGDLVMIGVGIATIYKTFHK